VVPGTNVFTIRAVDPSGNAATATYEVDVTDAPKTFTYDANGNLTADGTRTFEWDARNQPVAVTVGTHRSEFSYDGFQRRVRQVEKDNGITTADTRVLWCETAICEERAADGTTVTRRAFGLGEQVAGQAHFFTTDHLGSVREVTDTAGALLARYAFDPWGRRTLSAGSDVTTVGFTGHRDHGPSGLAMALYREYSPENGSWLTDDPIGLAGGLNLRAYSSNDPLNRMDPLGLQGIGNANTWTYGEIRQYAITSARNYRPPSGLGDAKASIGQVCMKNSCQATDGSAATAPADQAAWTNITQASGVDRSGGGNFMCVGTQRCWFVTRCYACVGNRKTLVPRTSALTPSGRVTLGGNTIYFYNDPLMGWCNAADKNSGCSCR
jgi:RHS repeat-associated protein